MGGIGRINQTLGGRIVIISLTALLITFSIAFYLVEKGHEKLVLEQVESQARVLFKQIVLTRRWIADHGGIFVEKLPWVKKNPYLKSPEVVDIEGRRYVKENPAYVTRQLSEYSKQEGLFWFHITSLKLVNPSNAPDPTEKMALIDFERKRADEFQVIERQGGTRIYRYIAPLLVEPACLECHGQYHLGDVRGAISISIPVEHLLKRMERSRFLLAGIGLAVSLFLVAFIYVSMKGLVIRPIDRLRTAMEHPERGELFSDKGLTEEIDALYRAFKEMMQKLRIYHDNLQDEVKKATEELRETNAKLLDMTNRYKQLSQRKSDFISSISHELRTPLTSIKGSICYLSKKLSDLRRDCSNSCDIEDIMSFLEIISSNADRLVRMVNETLDLEKIETGRMEFHFSTIHIDRLIREVTIEALPLLEQKKLSLKTSIEEPLPVRGDEDRLFQVLLNIITNAIEHSPENEEILLEAYKTGDWIIVRVSDRGPGVSPDMAEKVFERYYRGKKGGSGLGLAISKAIIEAHGGEIGVISEPGKRGSLFYFKLKRLKEEQ